MLSCVPDDGVQEILRTIASALPMTLTLTLVVIGIARSRAQVGKLVLTGFGISLRVRVGGTAPKVFSVGAQPAKKRA